MKNLSIALLLFSSLSLVAAAKKDPITQKITAAELMANGYKRGPYVSNSDLAALDKLNKEMIAVEQLAKAAPTQLPTSSVDPMPSLNPIDDLAVPTVDAVKKMLSSASKPVVWIYNESAPSSQPEYPKSIPYLQHKQFVLTHLNDIANADLKAIFPKLTKAQQTEWLKLTNGCRYTLLRLSKSESGVFNIRTFTESTKYGVLALLKKEPST